MDLFKSCPCPEGPGQSAEIHQKYCVNSNWHEKYAAISRGVNTLTWFTVCSPFAASDMLRSMEDTRSGQKWCSACSTQMPETAAFCPGCGRSMHVIARAEGKVGALPENVAGALAYFSFVPAIVFLFLDPYRRNRFVRFHAVQCLVVWLAGIVVALALRLLGMAVFLIPILGPLLVVIIDVAVILAALLLWLVLMIKALQGEMFGLPGIGAVAQQYSESAH